jgi:hypothetical protein
MATLRKTIGRVPGARALAQTLGLLHRKDRTLLLEQLPRDSNGAEIGVHLGDFSESLLSVAQPVTLHLVDPWTHETAPEYEGAPFGGTVQDGQDEMDRRHQSVRDRFADEIASGRVIVHRSTSDDVLSAMPDDSLDWIYIDGNHLYEFVKKDLELSLAKVRPGGLITGDDYGQDGWWRGGVSRAVDELLATGAVEAVMLDKESRQFALRRL